MHTRNSRSVFVFGDSMCAVNADTLREALDKQFARGQFDTLVLDLGQVRLCDSCGLRLLINIQRKAAAAGKQLILYRPDTILKDMLNNTNLSHLFTITGTMNDF